MSLPSVRRVVSAAAGPLAGLLALLCLGDPPAVGQPPAAQDGKRYAVLVGVQDYEHARLREPTPLKYAVADAAALEKALTAAGYQVTLLTDETGRRDPALAPTRANILRQIARVRKLCLRNDTLLLAFSGHGLQFAGDKEAYFCPQDAIPLPSQTGSLVPVSSIYDELEASYAGVKVILVDACRNDPVAARGKGGLDAESAAPPRGIAALFSCSPGQRAFEDDELGHGVFFHHVLRGLEGAAASPTGEVSLLALAEYVNGQVPLTVSRKVPDYQQSPELSARLFGPTPVLARVTLPERKVLEQDWLLNQQLLVIFKAERDVREREAFRERDEKSRLQRAFLSRYDFYRAVSLFHLRVNDESLVDSLELIEILERLSPEIRFFTGICG